MITWPTGGTHFDDHSQEFLGGSKPTYDWSRDIAQFFLGEIGERDLLSIGAAGSDRRAQELQCTAYFYAGMKRVLEGDYAKARQYFRKCLELDVPTVAEFQSAQAELKRLE
jgi:lipoprotein NlpI